MSYYTVTLPNYSIGEGCYREVPHRARFFGKKAVVIGGKTAMEKAKPKLLEGIAGSDLEITDFIWYGGNATYENGDALMQLDAVKNADILFGVGGGRACDTVKYVADKLDKPLFTFPTVASNCAAVTAISVIYKPDGSLREYYFPKIADHTFIESSIIADSPEELLWAGIGDASSKEWEAVFCSSGVNLTHTPLMGVQMSHVCTEPLLEYGEKALEDIRAKRPSFELDQVTLSIIISTGIVSNLVTNLPDSYYNSCLAHAFYNGFTATPVGHKHLHGEVVALGVLIQLNYAGEKEMLERVARFNLKVGLPVCLADVEVTDAELPTIVEKAQQTTEWKFKPKNRGITPESFLQCIKETDAYGRKLKEAAKA